MSSHSQSTAVQIVPGADPKLYNEDLAPGRAARPALGRF